MFRFLIILTYSLLIFGCGSNDKPVEPTTIEVEKSFIGTVNSNQDFISGLDATHVLLTDANTKIYLHSFLHDLNQYSNSRVRLSGVFSELNIANKQLSQLEVNSIDLLEPVVSQDEVQEFKVFNFDQIGLEINLPKEIQPKENDQSVFFSFGNSNFTISPIVLKSDFQTYLENYSDYASDLLRVDSKDYNLFILSDYEHLYSLDMGFYVVEIKVSLFDNSLQSQIDLILENLNFNALENSIFALNQQSDDVNSESEAESEADSQNLEDMSTSVTPQEKTNLNSELATEITPTNTEYASSLKIDEQTVNLTADTVTENKPVETLSPFDAEIKRFELSAQTLLSDLAEVTRYYFAESNHFYVEYVDVNGSNKRALIAYANNLNVVARFVEDQVQDWRLVSGQNLVYDQKLTLVDSSGKSHDLKEGFRLFESLPLKFSLQYPMQMYYMRSDDTYIFANDPNLKDISFSVSKVSSFDKLAYNKLNSNIYFNGVDYVIELPDSYLIFTNKALNTDVLNYILSTVSILSL